MYILVCTIIAPCISENFWYGINYITVKLDCRQRKLFSPTIQTVQRPDLFWNVERLALSTLDSSRAHSVLISNAAADIHTTQCSLSHTTSSTVHPNHFDLVLAPLNFACVICGVICVWFYTEVWTENTFSSAMGFLILLLSLILSWSFLSLLSRD